MAISPSLLTFSFFSSFAAWEALLLAEGYERWGKPITTPGGGSTQAFARRGTSHPANVAAAIKAMVAAGNAADAHPDTWPAFRAKDHGYAVVHVRLTVAE